MRQAHTRSETGGAERERIGLRGRNSKKTNRKRIAARRSDRLHQSTHDPVASLAIAFANAERAQSAARERAGREVVIRWIEQSLLPVRLGPRCQNNVGGAETFLTSPAEPVDPPFTSPHSPAGTP